MWFLQRIYLSLVRLVQVNKLFLCPAVFFLAELCSDAASCARRWREFAATKEQDGTCQILVCLQLMPELKTSRGFGCFIENVAFYFPFLFVLLSNNVAQLQWQPPAVQIPVGFLRCVT